jgi:hypothetical protein
VNLRLSVLAAPGILLAALAAFATGKPKEKPPEFKLVDSGVFSVVMDGRPVATETFSVEQDANGSITKSEFKTAEGVPPATQTSELEISPAGDLRRYEWKELTPGKAQATVGLKDEFLVERTLSTPQAKPEEQPFLLPASTSILDDYFFVHREILVWKYMAATCKHDEGKVQCPLGQKTQFGTLNPHVPASMPVELEFMGREKIPLKGQPQELNRFNLKSETGEWAIWMDDQFKIMRILIASEKTEILRQ